MTLEDYPRPAVRRLPIFSFDPALAARYDLAGVSGITIEIPWEDDLKPGSVGEYVEVVDIDPSSNAAYAPVNLNEPALLATDGLQPSESAPRFHQQMCYAVAMKTIEHFERALGRKALWSAHRRMEGTQHIENYVPRLRIYTRDRLLSTRRDHVRCIFAGYRHRRLRHESDRSTELAPCLHRELP